MARKRTITNPVTDSGLLSAIVRSELQTIHNEIIQGQSIFGAFGGDGNQGAIVVSSATNLSSIDDADRAGVIQCTSINISDTLTIDTGWLFLGCTGTVTISGTVDANGKGEPGGGRSSSGTPSGWADATEIAYDSYSNTTGGGQGKIDEKLMYYAFPVPFSVAGAGGAGACSGSLGYRFHKPGGGAGGKGGAGVYTAVGSSGAAATATPSAKIIALTGGLGDNTVKGYSHFNPMILLGRGAGGGGGHGASDGASGGNGGGVIYIECNELIFTGTLRSNGNNGGNDTYYGGGGGGGGVILVRAKTITTNSGSVTVTAGSGGSGSIGAGGAGAAGFKQIIQVLD